jgi:hypothetical protein
MDVIPNKEATLDGKNRRILIEYLIVAAILITTSFTPHVNSVEKYPLKSSGYEMEKSKRLKVGAFQFAACESIEKNLAALQRGIAKAAEQKVKLLLT